jgi:hypothetical protein
MMPSFSEERTERTHGLKSEPDQNEKQALFNLVNSPAWGVLLDILERACIHQETRLINCEVVDTERIIAEHRMAKAYWQIFIAMQKFVHQAAREFAGIAEEVPPSESEQVQSVEGMRFDGGNLGQ